MSGVVLATASLAFEQRVRRAFGGALNGSLRRWNDSDLQMVSAPKGTDDLKDLPDLVVFGPDVPIEVAMKVARTFDSDRPEVSVVVVAPPSPELWQQALHVGVRDVVDPDGSDDDMRLAFERAIEAAGRRRLAINSTIHPERGGRVITVLAPKGGSGKTAIASNLAVGLARRNPGKTVIVDLDLQFGDITHVLGLIPEHTMADAAGVRDSLDLTTLKVYLTKRADLYVLCAPDSPAAGEEVPPGQVSRILRLLAAEFDYVVVDTPAGITEHTLSAVELSSDLMLVCDLNVSSVRGMRKVVDALDRLDISNAPRHLVLNRADSRVGLDPREVPAMVGIPIAGEIPSTRSLPLSMNQAVPVLESEAKAPVSKKLRELVGLFAAVPARSGGHRKRRRG